MNGNTARKKFRSEMSQVIMASYYIMILSAKLPI